MRQSFISITALCCLALTSVAAAHASERLYLQYSGRAWGFLPLGQASLDVMVRPDAYRAGAALESGGMLKLFDSTQLKATAEGDVAADGPIWRRFDLEHTYAKKHRTTAMWVDADSVVTDIHPTWLRLGEPPATDEQKRASRDPLSSIVAMGVAVARTHACDGAFSTFDGRHVYTLRFKGDAKQGHMTTDGYDGPVIRCTLYYEPVAGYEAKEAAQLARKKTPKAEIWFALTENPDFAPPVKIVLPLGLGDASLTLSLWRRAEVAVDDAQATNLPLEAH